MNPFFHPGGPLCNDDPTPPGWYFWAEEAETYYGPFISRESAQKSLDEYVNLLDVLVDLELEGEE